MLQYLLNTTAIWFISLLAFDLFLRRESYHNYNRIFLLFTFLMGALLPLVQVMQSASALYPASLGAPLQQVIAVKRVIADTTVVTGHPGWQSWLILLYFAGATTILCLICIDVLKLAAFFRNGIKSRHGRWTVIETGKEHAPFSFLNTLFVCSRNQYNDNEWHMVLAHEGYHSSLLHFVDLLLMQLARIVFWFHPLVYLYNKRLLLVHEYQADAASAEQPQVYGKFLVEQAILQSAPILSHSFNRSPIKNRIIMLTRTSSAAAKTKLLVFIPLLLVCMLCFSKSIFSQNKTAATGPVAKMAKMGTSGGKVASWDAILEDPTVVCLDGGQVLSFSLSFQPKGLDYVGPFATQGNRLPAKGIEWINKFKEQGIEKVNMFVEDIRVKYKGEDKMLSPIIITVLLPKK